MSFLSYRKTSPRNGGGFFPSILLRFGSALCCGLSLLLVASCIVGCKEPPAPTRQTSSGGTGIYGVVRTLINNCNPVTIMTLNIFIDTRDPQVPGTQVYSGTFNVNDSYQVSLSAGAYLLIAQSGSCRFTRTVEVSAGQSSSVDLLLQ